MSPEIIKSPLLFPLSVNLYFVVIHRISAFNFQVSAFSNWAEEE